MEAVLGNVFRGLIEHRGLLSTLNLLCLGASLDTFDVNGESPLHLAVRNGKFSIVLTHTVFGADVNIRNIRGESPRHLAAVGGNDEILFALHAIGAGRCPQTMTSCTAGCAAMGQFDGTPPRYFSRNAEIMSGGMVSAVATKPSKGLRMLCLDGGGTRGLLLIQMLEEMEKVMGRPIVQCFDFISATGTGGVLALALAKGKTTQECRRLYFRLVEEIFKDSVPYDEEKLEKFLKDQLGESTVMADITSLRVMVTATRADRLPADLHVFRNYKSPNEILNREEKDPLTDEIVSDPTDQLVWKIARATSAFPFCFSPSGPFVDGGLIGNDPTLDALTEIFETNQAARIKGNLDEVSDIRVVVSLGAGRSLPKANDPSDLCKLNPELGLLGLTTELAHEVTQTEGRVCARSRALCSELGIPFYRLNPQLTDRKRLNEINELILVQMLWETSAHMRGMRKELLQLKTLLVDDA